MNHNLSFILHRRYEFLGLLLVEPEDGHLGGELVDDVGDG